MTASIRNKILLKGNYGRREEAVAGAAGLYPGMLVKLNSSGQVVVHDDEGGFAERCFVLEDVLQGKTKSDVYTINDIVSLHLALPGDEVQGLIEDGQNISVGDQLISAGNGKLKAASGLESGETLEQVIAIATADCDLTGSGTTDTLSPVRVL